MDNPTPTTVALNIGQIPVEMHNWLREEAHKSRQSIAELVRQAVAEFIGRQEESKG